MELALRFNDVGCLLYNMGREEDAFDLFSGAMRAMLLSSGGKAGDELDPQARQFLLIDPSVQRAFDKVNNCGAAMLQMASKNTTATNNTHHQSHNNTPPSPQTYHHADQDENDAASFANDAACNIATSRAAATVTDESNSSIDTPFIWGDVYEIGSLQNAPCDNTTRFAVALSIILYHEALVLHRGKLVTSNSKRCLERALAYYNMAWNSLQSCNQYFLQSNHFCQTLCCGILNNTGYILHQLGDFAASRSNFAKLFAFLTHLEPATNALEKRQREEFQLNYIVFGQSLSTAGAA